MRTSIGFAGGVVSVGKTGSTSHVFVCVTPPLEILSDLSSPGVIDCELRILGLEIMRGNSREVRAVGLSKN